MGGQVRTGFARAHGGILRGREAVIPPLIIGALFDVVNVGTPQKLGEQAPNVGNCKAFQLPPAVVFAIAGVFFVGFSLSLLALRGRVSRR